MVQNIFLEKMNLNVSQMKVLNLLLHQELDYLNYPKFRVKFEGSCLTTNKAVFGSDKIGSDKIINLYIVLEIKSWSFYTDNGFPVGNSLFGAVRAVILNLDMVFYLMYMNLSYF